MLTQVAVNRATGEGRYEDVIDVAEYLGESVYGSASNALVAMCRQSHLFQETKRKLDAERKPEPASSGK